jgi:hypothetical protein
MNREENPGTIEQDALKEALLEQLRQQDNPLLLRRIGRLLDEAETYDELYQIPQIRQLAKEEEEEDLEIRNYQSLPAGSALERYDRKAARPLFYLAALSLLVIGALVTAITEEDLSEQFSALLPWLGGLMGLLYLLFVADAALLFYYLRRGDQKANKREKYFRLLALLFPPLRIGSRDIVSAEYIWIPRWRWCKVNAGLFRELKRRFILPMIGIAMLIVPVLIVEWKLMDWVRRELPQLQVRLILESVQTFIWVAFTFEFLLMISISERKFEYVKKNWIDLLIILLPFVSFLRSLRISQIARLKYATRSFKLRGVVTKARQGLILADFLQRIFRLKPENELKRLHRQLRENQREREDLEHKLKETARRIQQRKARKS